MNRLIALFYFVLSLVGLDVGGSSFEHRATANGTDVLLSRAHVQAGVARFDCVHSASGECHYIVLPKACAATDAVDPPAGCAQDPIARFTLAQGESHQVSGLQSFRLCVGPASGPAGEQCQSASAGADRNG